MQNFPIIPSDFFRDTAFSALKHHFPVGKCFVKKAGTNEHLIVTTNNKLAFNNSFTDGEPLMLGWDDDEGNFSLYLPEKNCYVGVRIEGLYRTLVASKDTYKCRFSPPKKAKFWARRVMSDGSVELRVCDAEGYILEERKDKCIGLNTGDAECCLRLQFHE